MLLVLLLGTLSGQAAGVVVASLQDQASHQTPAGEGARATQETIVSSKEAKQLFRSVDEILQFASEDTGLPIKHKVKRRLAKRDEVQSYIQKSMKEDKDAKRLERSSAVLKKFGLLPRNFDLSNFLVTMLREQVAGYYDVKTKTVNLLNWVDVEQQKPVLAHELTHALQDQSFGIEKWMKGSTEGTDNKKNDPSASDIENDEESGARQAIVEGQAMVVLLDYSLAPTGKTLLDSPQIVEALKQGMLVGTADSPAFRDAPIFLKEELTFPYRYGLDFTSALLKAGGKELAYAGAFKNPPKTTREIMEPETYLAHEKLEPMKMIDMEKDFKGYDPFDIGAMGEFDVDVLVEQYAGRDEAGGDLSGMARRILLCRAGRRRQIGADRVAVCFPLVERGESGGVRGGVCEIADAAVSEAARAGRGWQSCGRCAAGGFLANLARTACLADGRGSCSD